MGTSPKPAFRRLRLALILLIGLLLVALIEPHLLRFTVKHALIQQARRHQHALSIGKVEGSLFEPLIFRKVTLSTERPGVSSQTAIEEATADFSWNSLLFRRGHPFFDRLSLSGVESRFDYTTQTAAPSGERPPVETGSKKNGTGPWLPFPARFDLHDATLRAQSGERHLVATGVNFRINRAGTGEIALARLQWTSPPTERTFKNLRGTTAIQGTRLVIGDLAISEDLLLKTLSSELGDLAQGKWRATFDFEAFGGHLKGDLFGVTDGGRPHYEVAGNFARISVAGLARFLDHREPAGGLVNEGKFTFRGSPHALDQATLSVRLEASDFQWGKRKWNSLLLGATIFNGKVDLPELVLHQSENSLKLKGDLLLPQHGVPWWESQFAFDVDARINDLGTLSSLLGPRFSDTAGKMNVVGAIRGRDRQFHGQLMLSGSGITYRGAPLEVVNAGVKLEGNDIQIINLEIANGRDFVRGKGGINIYGEKRYWGELKASIAQLDPYRPLLQKPVTPVPLSGGVEVDWSGDGTMQAHSGAFTARFRKLHTPGTPEIPATLPMDAELEGTYSPGAVALSRFVLAEEKTRLEAQVAANETELRLSGLRLTSGQRLWLEGEAILPVNLRRWWLEPGTGALLPESPFKTNLKANQVQLSEVATLTGHPIPLGGVLSGQLETDGTLRDFSMKGVLSLSKGTLPPNRWLPPLDAIEGEATLDGPVLTLERLSARHTSGSYRAKGRVDLTRFDHPRFDLALESDGATLEAAHGWKAKAALALRLEGEREAAQLNGTAQLLELLAAPSPYWGPLLRNGDGLALAFPPPVAVLPEAMRGWQIGVDLVSENPVHPADGGTLAVALRYAGSGEVLEPTGSLTFARKPLLTPFATALIEEATFQWIAGESEPRLSARITGSTSDIAFSAYYFGALSKLSSTMLTQPEIPEADLLLHLRQGYAPLGTEAGELDLPPFLPQAAPQEEAATSEPPGPDAPDLTTTTP